jgi:TPR repeat protein
MRRTILLAAITISILNTEACPADRVGLHTDSAISTDEDYQKGKKHCSGDEIIKDYASAIGWFQKIADKGDAKGETPIGLHTGQGSAQKHAEVHKWLTKTAEQGDPSCQYNVGMMYLEGLGGVAQDHQEALKWFQKAAGQGHQGANYLLKKLQSDSGLNAKRYK